MLKSTRTMKHLITTLGPRRRDELDLILPHEHIFTDLRTLDHPDHGQANVADVVARMGPEVERARRVGVTAMVEATPVGVGRRPDAVIAVSQATGMPFVVPTGVYREPWMPRWVHEATEDRLAEWMIGELSDQIEMTGVRAGWIKLSAGDDGLTASETKVLRAAARAAVATGAVIGSHTRQGRVLMEQADIVEKAGHTPERLIWIHAHVEPDVDLHLAAARRGVWIEYDAIGQVQDDDFVELIGRLLDAGFGDRILLSQDRGWFDPALPGGGTPRPFTYLSETFLPSLSAGLDAPTIRRLTAENPFAAFSR
jgi:phosphotriesterase-related protein